ncbi:trans-Golgi network integral membrane protein TGN38-like isoform X2 [Limulus polyphemus]|uniref:Trans-Golgi network integral membrane protein TGN38-like isoform X2 n=1 Tax=Limulus polyphemus TaxID=6850 RepID=A0ABM1SHH0_LIMPO|nr:trans-Golgi network integral membrane protein TGN38-like isoform X2 [Limulus polyphemus]
MENSQPVDEMGKKMVSSQQDPSKFSNEQDPNVGGGYIRNSGISENSQPVDEMGKKMVSSQQYPSKFPNEQDPNVGGGYIRNSGISENSQPVDEMGKKMVSSQQDPSKFTNEQDPNVGGGYIRNSGISENSQPVDESGKKQLDQDTQVGLVPHDVNEEDEQWDFTEKDADDEDDDLLYVDGKLSNENQNVPHKANSGNPTYPKMVEPFPEAEDTHFLAYFLTAVVLCVIAYLVFHNKRKILDLIHQRQYPNEHSTDQACEVKPLI